MSNPSNEWQDISSAPKDGTWILGYQSGALAGVYLTWDSERDAWIDEYGDQEFPAKWIPAPALPTPPDQPVEAAKESVCEGCGDPLVKVYGDDDVEASASLQCENPDCQPKDPAACDDCAKSVILPHECPNDPAAQTDSSLSAHSHNEENDAARTPTERISTDRTEGEVVAEKRMQFVGSTVLLRACGDYDCDFVTNDPDGVCPRHTLMDTVQLGHFDMVPNRDEDDSLAAAQASTHPRIERLERIEVAAKELPSAWEEMKAPAHRDSAVPYMTVDRIVKDLAALLDDEGDGAK